MHVPQGGKNDNIHETRFALLSCHSFPTVTIPSKCPKYAINFI